MYHPALVAAAQRRLEVAFKDAFPKGLARYPVDVCAAMAQRLAPAVDADGQPTRRLTPEEDAFIANERLLTKIDYRYCAERYHKIRTENGLQPLFPLWEPQEIILQKLAQIQWERHQSGHPDGLLVNVLKARQEGSSTISQSLCVHRVTTHTHIPAMTASDVPENSGSEGLFGKFELMVEHLPWYLKPGTKFHTKNTHWVFDNGSWMTVESGKSMKGGLTDEGGTKGNLGRSKTFTVCHLSEISTWERPEQIDDGLLPAIPRSPRTLVLKESTAKGRHNWHHEDWLTAKRGRGRFVNIFLPWYALSKYWLPAPVGWIPADTTLEHASKAEQEGPRWLGRAVHLTRDQLYWYEDTRATYAEKGKLANFLEEFAADDEACFQASGRSIFSHDQLAYLTRIAKPMIDCWSVEPAASLALDKSEALAQIRMAKSLAAIVQDGPGEPLGTRVDSGQGREAV